VRKHTLRSRLETGGRDAKNEALDCETIATATVLLAVEAGWLFANIHQLRHRRRNLQRFQTRQGFTQTTGKRGRKARQLRQEEKEFREGIERLYKTHR